MQQRPNNLKRMIVNLGHALVDLQASEPCHRCGFACCICRMLMPILLKFKVSYRTGFCCDFGDHMLWIIPEATG